MSTEDASHGLELPDPLPVGYPDPELRERWIAVTAVLMARGIRGISEMQRALSRPIYTPSYPAVKGWMEIVKSRYSSGLSRQEIEEGRGLLLAEMDEVSRVAWATIFQILKEGVEVHVKGDVLRVDGLDKIAPLLSQITAANRQKATLYGLDQVKIDIRRVNTELDVAKIVEVAAQSGIPVDALRGLGNNIARLMSGGNKDGK